MSFSREVKIELCEQEYDLGCKKAFISAIIKMNSSLNISNKGLSVDISFQNATIIKKIYRFLNDIYHEKPQIIVQKNMKLNKTHYYTIRIFNNTLAILEDLKLMDGLAFKSKIDLCYFQNANWAKAYIAGSFVAAGSVNSPSKANYHLEIQSSDLAYLEDLKRLIDLVNKGKYALSINFKIIKRRSNYVLYIKSAREIVDFLNYLQATTSMFNFEDIRMQRDFVNSINRMNNMDVANEQKVQKAANEQIEAINKLITINHLKRLDIGLRNIANLRLKYSDASLSELVSLYEKEYQIKISRSAINHRLKKLKDIALKIK
ncbi:MAG: DNA-binding protein WhiA [Bacilli bacterium]|jgi:DNA-binding protein WhiA|nr:DNA-binding protein WhiA [Bacilli bacterium]